MPKNWVVLRSRTGYCNAIRLFLCLSSPALDDSDLFSSSADRLLLLLWSMWKNMTCIVSEFTCNKFWGYERAWIFLLLQILNFGGRTLTGTGRLRYVFIHSLIVAREWESCVHHDYWEPFLSPWKGLGGRKEDDALLKRGWGQSSRYTLQKLVIFKS